MIYTDVGCCCSLFDVVSSVVFSFCLQVSKQMVCFFFCFFLFFFFLVFFFFFFSSLSLSPILLFSLSLFPFFVDFPHNLFFFFFFLFIYLFFFLFFFPFFFLLSLSCFLCPLVLSVTVWLSKRVYKIKLIN